MAGKEKNVKEIKEKRVYTVDEVKDILGISRPTVYNLLKEKEFSWVRVPGGKYRISKRSFDEWLDQGAEPKPEAGTPEKKEVLAKLEPIKLL